VELEAQKPSKLDDRGTSGRGRGTPGCTRRETVGAGQGMARGSDTYRACQMRQVKRGKRGVGQERGSEKSDSREGQLAPRWPKGGD